ncbi:MAG: 50S ribosomal protein L21e [Methermicoccaceae archaeon]
MDKSHGARRKTRQKLQKPRRQKGLTSITRALQVFDEGKKVHIRIDPSVHKGAPHHRYHGRTGEVVEKRGRAYIVRVRDGGTYKNLTVLPVHLTPQHMEQTT